MTSHKGDGRPIVGVDEVGRGCLAGPVMAGAVLWTAELGALELADSKVLSPKQREVLSEKIRHSAKFGIGVATVEEIDQRNILQATFLAMTRAIEAVLDGLTEARILVDGNQKIPGLRSSLLQETIIGGDAIEPVISAASIVAKVARDKHMCDLSKIYSDYFFEKNKGYGSEEHRVAIQKYGPTPLHRKTFAGVREFLREPRPGTQLSFNESPR